MHSVILECTWFKLRKGLVKDKERIKGIDITELIKNITGLIKDITELSELILQN